MKLSLAITSIAAFAFAHAEPLTPVKPDIEKSIEPSEAAGITDALKKEFPEASISVRTLETFDHEITRTFLAHGKLHRVSAVVAYPEAKHAALLEFTIYNQQDGAIVLPLAGEHSEFASLLRFANKKLRGTKDAVTAGKAFAAIYRLNLVHRSPSDCAFGIDKIELAE